jgi:hypothetical protein
MRSKILLYAGLACTALVLAPTTAATAATGPSTPQSAVDFPALTVTIPLIPLPPGADVSATAPCPAGTVVLSGGVSISSAPSAINASAPVGSTAWKGYANNLSSKAMTFNVYAVCATKPAGYAKVTGSLVSVATVTQASAGAVCPAGDVVTGGGVTDEHNVKIDMASSYPAALDEWVAAVSNNSSVTQTIQAVAICASAAAFPGYAIQSTTAPNPSGAQTSLTENCTSGAPLGGGNQTSVTINTGIWMKTTRQIGAAWRAVEYNGSALNANLTVYAICAT